MYLEFLYNIYICRIFVWWNQIPGWRRGRTNSGNYVHHINYKVRTAQLWEGTLLILFHIKLFPMILFYYFFCIGLKVSFKWQYGDMEQSRHGFSILISCVWSSNYLVVLALQFFDTLLVQLWLISYCFNCYYKVIIQLVRSLDTIKVPAARAMIVWLLGEYCSLGEMIPRMLSTVLKYLAWCFTSEGLETKLQILNTITKVYH